MEQEHRKRLENRLAPLHLYKLTPKTNCGECGFPSCLAFATQVIVAQAELDACPYLDRKELQPFRDQLAEQHQSGIGVSRESFEKTLQFLREEVRKWDLESIAESLGAAFVLKDGRPALVISYFSGQLTVTEDDATDAFGKSINPWEKILLYNYIIGGATEPSGTWVGMESIPNSISKIKSLKAHCESPLAEAFAGKLHLLPGAIAGLGNAVSLADENVDFAAEFRILPRLSVRVLWWDEDRAEGFRAQTKFLFDARVLQILDLESLIFACEQVTDRLLERVRQ